MQDTDRNIVCKDLAPYLDKEGLNSASSLLRGVRRALEDIKKEKPRLAELEITEISFLKEQNNRGQNSSIILKVYFDAAPTPATTP